MPEPALRPAIFLDRDGTLMHDTGYVSDPASIRIFPGVPEALRELKARGFLLIIVTNQSGIGRGYFTRADYEAVHARFLQLLGPGLIDATYLCDDHPDRASDRRKPAPGMLLEAARDHAIDLARSWMIGDREADITAGHRAGTRSILVLTGEDALSRNSTATFTAESLSAATHLILTTQNPSH